MWSTCVSLWGISLSYRLSRMPKSYLRSEARYTPAVHALSCIWKCKQLCFLTTVTGLTPPRMGWERNLGFLPYGDQQRKHTRLAHEGLNPIALRAHKQLQEYEAVVLLGEIATTPKAFLNHIRRWVYWYPSFSSKIFLRDILGIQPAWFSI